MKKRILVVLILFLLISSLVYSNNSIVQNLIQTEICLAEKALKIPYLRNEMSTSSLKRFKDTVRRQAMIFPDDYFLEALDYDLEVALTFDDGPDAKYTEQILDILKRYNIKATFFLLGKNMQEYPEVAKRIMREDHAIGNHSYDHVDLRKLSKEIAFESQIEKTQVIFDEQLGFRPVIFRPPYGAVKDEQIAYFAQQGIKIINWSIDTFDWDSKQNSPEQINEKIARYFHEGAIILMHSGGGDRSKTVAALPGLIEFLLDRGYKFMTIPEMLEF